MVREAEAGTGSLSRMLSVSGTTAAKREGAVTITVPDSTLGGYG